MIDRFPRLFGMAGAALLLASGASGDEQTAALGSAPLSPTQTAEVGQSAVTPDERSGNPLWSLPLSSLNATRDRPLFSPTRRPPAKPAPVEAAPAAPPPPPPPAAAAGPEGPPFELLGAILGGGTDTAVVRNLETHAIARLRLGQEEEGWRAAKISRRQVKLQKGDEVVTLDIVKPAAGAGVLAPDEPTPAPPPRSARKADETGKANHVRD